MITKYLTLLQGQQPSSGGALLGTGASEVQMPGSPESSNNMDNEATRTMIMNLLEADAGLATIAFFKKILNRIIYLPGGQGLLFRENMVLFRSSATPSSYSSWTLIRLFELLQRP